MPNVVITSAGLAALVNAENNGTLPVKITKFRLGTGNYTPSADQTALPEQIQRNYGTVWWRRWGQHNPRHDERYKL